MVAIGVVHSGQMVTVWIYLRAESMGFSDSLEVGAG